MSGLITNVLSIMFIHLNIRVRFTRSHPSKGEDLTGSRSKSCKCKQALHFQVFKPSSKQCEIWHSQVGNMALKIGFLFLFHGASHLWRALYNSEPC